LGGPSAGAPVRLRPPRARAPSGLRFAAPPYPPSLRMRRRRSPARWLAPLALVACAVAVYSIVNNGLGAGDAKTTPSATTTSHRTGTTSKRSKGTKRRSGRARTYTVKSGDTLSSIAVKSGLTLERIQQLNPKLDSQSLQTGQRVKLSP